MVAGQSGQSGLSAVLHVTMELKQELAAVPIQCLSTMVVSVKESTQRIGCASRDTVQLTVHGCHGLSGVIVLTTVEEACR